jgi:hypothetical protein
MTIATDNKGTSTGTWQTKAPMPYLKGCQNHSLVVIPSLNGILSIAGKSSNDHRSFHSSSLPFILF